MKRVLIIDTETTGLSPEKDQVIEVGAILYSVEHAAPIESYAALIRAEGNAQEAVNHISPALLVDAHEPSDVWAKIHSLSKSAQAILAHSAEFDKSFCHPEIQGCLPWICTKDDITWPKQSKPGLSLVNLVLDHGVGVVAAHRALADCDMISRLLTRVRELGTNLEVLLSQGLRPKAMFQAMVSFDDRELAKKWGFWWKGDTKQWLRIMAIEDAQKLGFKVRQIDVPLGNVKHD